MAEGGDRPKSGGSGGAGRLRYGLPSDLAGSLRHLDERQLDRLHRAVVGEVRRRGRLTGDEQPSPPPPGSGKAQGGAPPGGGNVTFKRHLGYKFVIDARELRAFAREAGACSDGFIRAAVDS